MIGGGFDGNYYGAKGNESVLSALGNVAPVNGLTPDWPAKIAKQLGATKMASIAYSSSPSGTASAEAIQKYAAPAFDLKNAYLNTTLDFGTKDVGPIVLGIKNSGADGLYLPLDNDTNVAIVQALQQNGVKMKANVLATGYSQQLLDQPVAKLMTPNDVLFFAYKPVELTKDPAVKKFRANLKKYAGITGVPDYGSYTGYIVCDMAITGLEQAGANPTRQGFVDGIRKLGKYDAAGLTCLPVQVGYDTFGTTPETSCNWFLIVKDGKFKVLNGGKPITSKLLGDPKLVAANRARDCDDDHDCACRLRGAAMTSSTESRRVEARLTVPSTQDGEENWQLAATVFLPAASRSPNVRPFSWPCRAPVTAAAISISRSPVTAKRCITIDAARSWSHWTTSGWARAVSLRSK